MMDSLISISGGNGDFSYLTSNVIPTTSSGSSNVFTTSKERESLNSNTSQTDPRPIECRHTVGAKKGSFVPELVRRALGGVSSGQNLNTFGPSVVGTSNISSSYYDDMTSSISSCQSNLDNIKPPTIMDDQRFMDQMDNSILSIASISSEIAPIDGMQKSTGSGKIPIFEIMNNEANNETLSSFNMNSSVNANDSILKLCDEEPISMSCCTALDDIAPPTLMDDVSGCTRTLIADSLPRHQENRDSDQTYTIQGEVMLYSSIA
jgi:hypothetical protein